MGAISRLQAVRPDPAVGRFTRGRLEPSVILPHPPNFWRSDDFTHYLWGITCKCALKEIKGLVEEFVLDLVWDYDCPFDCCSISDEGAEWRRCYQGARTAVAVAGLCDWLPIPVVNCKLFVLDLFYYKRVRRVFYPSCIQIRRRCPTFP